MRASGAAKSTISSSRPSRNEPTGGNLGTWCDRSVAPSVRAANTCKLSGSCTDGGAYPKCLRSTHTTVLETASPAQRAAWFVAHRSSVEESSSPAGAKGRPVSGFTRTAR
jgi:hypothetical protein